MFQVRLCFCLLVLSTQMFANIPYPDSLQNQSFSYRVQCMKNFEDPFNHLDSISRKACLQQFLQWAEESKDVNLKFFFRWSRLKLLFWKERQNPDIPNELESLIYESGICKDYFIQAEARQLLGYCYWERKEFSLSIEQFAQAYGLYSEFNQDDFPNKGEYTFDYGSKHQYFGDYQTAKSFFLEMWNHTPQNKIENIISKVNTIAYCYRTLNQFDSALYYFHLAEEFAIKLNSEVWMGIISGNIANIYYLQKKYDLAIPLAERNIEISTRNNELVDLAMAKSMLSDIRRIQNNPKAAMQLSLEAYHIIVKKGFLKNYYVMKNIYRNLANAYAANGDLKTAYLYLDSASMAKDSFAVQRNQLAISGAKYRVEVQKHISEIKQKEYELLQQKKIRNGWIAGAILMILISVIAIRQKIKVSQEKKRSDELLLNILPEETAEELKLKGFAEAKSYDEVTAMFTDFKNFTIASEQLTAHNLVKEINYFYSAFDKIVSKYNIEKIKTIGDSYMCAGGLPVANKTNAFDVIQAAMEIQDFMQKHKLEREAQNLPYFQLRIGIHTGPVVAGIVGIIKFAYDIWGDTVNVAAAMEHQGVEGKINISGSTYEIIKHKYHCTYRGKIPAKNKGEIDMYFVDGVKEEG